MHVLALSEARRRGDLWGSPALARGEPVRLGPERALGSTGGTGCCSPLLALPDIEWEITRPSGSAAHTAGSALRALPPG